MNGMIWPSISLALYVALLVAAVAAQHINNSWTLHKQRNVTTTLNAKRERNSYTTLTIGNKHNGLGLQLPPATYAVYPSSQVMLSRLIMLMQETQTVNYLQHIEDATPVEVAPPSPSHTPQHNHSSRQPDNQPNNT